MDSLPAIEPLPLESIKQDLMKAYIECSARGLVHSAHWCVCSVCVCSVCLCVCVCVFSVPNCWSMPLNYSSFI